MSVTQTIRKYAKTIKQDFKVLRKNVLETLNRTVPFFLGNLYIQNEGYPYTPPQTPQ
jgi:ethanolamine utilization cobalamin adenosyltransferase